MLDLFNLPTSLGKADVQVFSAPTTGLIPSGQNFTYYVPRGKTMLYIYCVGGGSGGGGGRTGTAGTARGGGGGGSSGAVSTLLIPTAFIPNILSIQVASSVPGGAADTAGTQGNPTWVYLGTLGNTANPPSNSLVYAGAGGGGGAGTGAAVGSGGSIATSAITSMLLAGAGLYTLTNGQTGTNGGAIAGGNGVAQAIPTIGINVMGGTGGGGTTSADFAGGGITAVTDSFISNSRPTTPAAGSNVGSGGFSLPNLMWHFPGLGGSSSNTGAGGNGGNGGIGCGGGGGGAGTAGGRGGAGGAGLVVMIAW